MTALLAEPEVAAHLPADVDPLHLHYIFIGATGAFFSQAPECRRVSGRDPSDPAMVEAHAEAVVRLFLGETK